VTELDLWVTRAPRPNDGDPDEDHSYDLARLACKGNVLELDDPDEPGGKVEVSATDFLYDNREDSDVIAAVVALDVGEEARLGGGAQPVTVIRRVQ